MVLINEFLPNPIGTDTNSEWIELRNDGKSAIDLNGWRITPGGKKFFALHGTINAGGYLVVPRSQSKITLKNTDGTLALYDVAGHLEDQAKFQGTAQEGQSANRTASGFSFGKPTPGAANVVTANTAVVYNNSYPLGVPLNPAQAPGPQFLGGLLGTAVMLAAAILFILKSHEDLSQLFFGGYESAGRGNSSAASS